MGSAGLVRALCPSRDGSNLIIGHTSGWLSVLDLRTGKVKKTWKVCKVILFYSTYYRYSFFVQYFLIFLNFPSRATRARC